MLVIVVDLSSERPEEDLATIERELRAYDPELAARRRLVVGAKADLVEDADERLGRLGRDAIAVSAVTGVGLDELATRVERMVAEAEGEVGERVPTVVLRPGRRRFVIRREGDRYRVVGRNVERWVAETDFEDPRRIVELQKRLVREGVERQLVAAGARRGDEVVIGDRAFEFIPEEG
jgi:GTP-binding protein